MAARATGPSGRASREEQGKECGEFERPEPQDAGGPGRVQETIELYSRYGREAGKKRGDVSDGQAAASPPCWTAARAPAGPRAG